MRIRIVHHDASEQDRMDGYAKQLLSRTLERYRPQIRSVTVKVSLSPGISSGEFDYHCAVQICMTQGRRIEIETRDCDEVLAIYRAVDKARNIMEHQPGSQIGEACDGLDRTIR